MPEDGVMAPEAWRPIKGWERLYQISTLGRIVSQKTGKILKPTFNPRSRSLQLKLRRQNGTTRNVTVARIVVETFLGPIDNKRVAFRDGDSRNCAVSNLLLETRSGNHGGYRTRVIAQNISALSRHIWTELIPRTEMLMKEQA